MELHWYPGCSLWDTDAFTWHKHHHSISAGREASDLTQFILQVPVCSVHLLLNLALELISIPWPPSIHAAGLTCNPLLL